MMALTPDKTRIKMKVLQNQSSKCSILSKQSLITVIDDDKKTAQKTNLKLCLVHLIYYFSAGIATVLYAILEAHTKK